MLFFLQPGATYYIWVLYLNSSTQFFADVVCKAYFICNFRGLYISYPIFTAVYNQEGLILQTIYILNKESLQ